jgi:uncharacterized membrane protein YgcG
MEIPVKKLWLSGLLIVLVSASAFAADGPKEVEAALQQGNYTLAEQELRQAIVEHPQSAKAHYMLAQVLAHEGNIGDAQKEAAQAKTIDPKISFTNPARFEHFQTELNQALAPATARPAAPVIRNTQAEAPPVAAEPRSSGSIWPWIIGAVIIVLLIGWFRRRQQGNMGNQPYGNPGNPGYGASGPQSPYGNNSYPPPGYQQAPGSGPGLGTSVLGGLAGGVLGAAAVEAYENHERNEQNERDVFQPTNNTAPNPQDQAYNDLRSQPIDTGNDDSSWGDSSGGGDDSFGGGGDDDSWS